MASETNSQLPVIVAGAGPCGLFTALVLKSKQIPFLILERAVESKLLSNVGSGFDLDPVSIDILGRHGVEVDKVFHSYAGMYIASMDTVTATTTGEDGEELSMAKPVRLMRMEEMAASVGRGKDSADPLHAVSASRSVMQEVFMNLLFEDGTLEREKVLRCGVEVQGFTDKEEEGYVKVHLGDGSDVRGLALLGCDGIHSKVRKHFMADVEDHMNFCNVTAYWGKTQLRPGSDLQKAVEETQRYKEQGSSFLWILGTRRLPGSFMAAPYGDELIWAYSVKSDKPPPRTSDLTKRGAVVFDDAAKKAMFEEPGWKDRPSLVKLAISETEVSSISCVGLFDRKNLDLPYTRGRVALLGDSAHPQTPFMGQGCNMALADAYVCSLRLAAALDSAKRNGGSQSEAVKQALQEYGSQERKDSVNDVIRKARSYADFSVTNHWFSTWSFNAMMKFSPLSWIMGDMLSADKSNRDFVAKVHADLELK